MKGSIERLKVAMSGLARCLRRPKTVEQLKFTGHFHVKHFRKGVMIDEWDSFNALTNEGKNAILDIIYNNGTNPTALYMLLIDNAGFTALSANDTYAEINQSGNGWDEFSDYTDPANSDSAVSRPAWNPGAAATQAVTNSSPVLVDITDLGVVKGLGIVYGASSQTKGDNTNTGHVLINTTLFSGGDRSVSADDQLQITFTVSL